MPESFRIAYLTGIYPRASDSFIRTEIDALRRQGVDVQTVAVRRPNSAQLVSDDLRSEAASTYYILEPGLVRLCVIAGLQLLVHPIRTLRAARLLFSTHATGLRNRLVQTVYLAEAAGLARHLKQHGIKHVHNHIGENSATVAMLAAEMSDLTYSMTIHGPGMFFHPRQWALGEKIRRSSFTACISNFCVSQCMIFARPDTWQKLRLVRCGIDRGFFRTQSEQPPPSPRFVCVGRLCPEKGHLILLESVRHLVSQGQALELHLIGDGESRDEIERFVDQAGLRANVILHGWASAEQIRQQLQSSRALILPSFAEGLPVVFMESLAMQRPVIATAIAGIPELIKDGENGWLVNPADVKSLSEAIQKAIDATPADIQRMGTVGAHLVARYHDSQKESAKLKQLFSAVLSGEPLPNQETLECVARQHDATPTAISPPARRSEILALQG